MNFLQWSRRISSRPVLRSKAEYIRQKKHGRRKLIDLKKVRVCGGKGGDGAVSFKNPSSNKVHVGGPDGGDGGDGGGVVFVADPSVKSLQSLLGHYRGGNGRPGQGSYHQGNSSKDVVIKVPLGTVIRDRFSSPTGQEVLCDLLTPGSSCLVARGGWGGLGNARFATSEDRKPTEQSLGCPGEERFLEVELQTIADVGLVGFPNAGKSTLLRALSRARPKVGDYPFTTIRPEIGVMEWAGSGDGARREEEEEEEEVEVVAGDRIRVADIPGLVPDAHLNKGLGHSFLRHVQRCSTLLLVLDSSDTQTDMAAQLGHLRRELELYDSRLPGKARLIVANKMDSHYVEEDGEEGEGGRGLRLVDGEFEAALHRLYEKAGIPVVPVSALRLWNIGPLRGALFRMTRLLESSQYP